MYHTHTHTHIFSLSIGFVILRYLDLQQILISLSGTCFPSSISSEYRLLSCVCLFVTLRTVSQQAPLSLEFSRREYRCRLSFPTPGDLPEPGTEPRFSALPADCLWSELPGRPQLHYQTPLKIDNSLSLTPTARVFTSAGIPFEPSSGRHFLTPAESAGSGQATVPKVLLHHLYQCGCRSLLLILCLSFSIYRIRIKILTLWQHCHEKEYR